MKLSISNIAWEQSEDKTIFNLMTKYGFNGIELAPPKIFNDPSNVDDKDIRQYLDYIKPYKYNFPAMQSFSSVQGNPEDNLVDMN